MTLLEKLYRRIPENIAKPVHVANPDFLHNSLTIKENGTYDVSSIAEVNVNVKGGGDEPEPTRELLFDGSVEATHEGGDGSHWGEVPYSVDLNYSSLIVEFEGVKYTVENISKTSSEFDFGAPMVADIGYDFSEYPFAIAHWPEEETDFSVQNSGTYSLKIWANSDPIDSGGDGPEPAGKLLFNSTFTTDDFGGGIYYSTFDDVANELNYSSIIVDFNGTRYTLNGTYDTGAYLFGASVDSDTHEVDFSEYPVAIIYEEATVELMFITETSLTCTVKIWANSDPIDDKIEPGK